MHRDNFVNWVMVIVIISMSVSVVQNSGLFGFSVLGRAAADSARLDLLSLEEKAALVKASMEAIRAELEGKPVELKESIASDGKVYVTLRKQGKLIGCQPNRVESGDLVQKAVEATIRAMKDKRFSELEESETSEVSVEINVLGEFQEIKARGIALLDREIELGIHGIKIEKNGKSALLLPAVAVRKLYSLERTIKELCKKAGLEESCLEDPGARLYRFKTDNFVYYNGGLFDLYRGNRLVEEKDVTVERMEESIGLTARWFKANNDLNGLFNYDYSPGRDWLSGENSRIRQLAGLWTAGKIANHLGDRELLELCLEKAEAQAAMLEEENSIAWLDESGTGKLGTTALFLQALLELNEGGRFDREIEMLGNFILEMQAEDGSFYTHYPKKVSESSVDFYPGEALLALMSAYEKTGRAEYLKAVERAFPYYREYFGKNKKTAFVPWQSSAYSRAFNATGKKEYAEFVFEMTDWILGFHYGEDAPYPDYVGGYKRGHYPASNTCTYSEGVADALAAARSAGELGKAEKYGEAMDNSMRMALQLQFDEKNTYYAEKPELAIGGFRKSLANDMIRVDNPQHCGSAILKYIELEKSKAG